jgi:hypothetical protein
MEYVSIMESRCIQQERLRLIACKKSPDKFLTVDMAHVCGNLYMYILMEQDLYDPKKEPFIHPDFGHRGFFF